MTLKTLQQTFQAYLLGHSTEMSEHVRAVGKRFAKQRLDIYADGYFLRLLEIFAVDFPKLKKTMGERAFADLISDYLDAHPSCYFSVRYVGNKLSEFIATTPPYHEQPVWRDMAIFEWALVNSADAPDAPVLTAADLSSIPAEQWSDMVITLHPSVEILALNEQVPVLWRAIEEDKRRPTRVLLEKAATTTFIVWRKEVQSYFLPQTLEEANLLRMLQQQKTFGEVCEDVNIEGSEEDVAQYVVNALLRWLPQGILSQVTVV